jgi:endonuclease III
MNKLTLILDYFNELYPNAGSELKFSNDYQLLIAIVLSAQTTDKKVNQVTRILFDKYPTLMDIRDASMPDLQEILKPIGMYYKKAKFIKELSSIICNEYDGKVPHNREQLNRLPGVGRKSENLILAMLYNEPFIAVDTHVSRVSKRLGLANNDDNVSLVEKELYKKISKQKRIQYHYQTVLFGRYKCKSIKPDCLDCKLIKICKVKRH